MKTALKNYFAREILSYLSLGDEKLLYVGKPAGVILVPSLALLGVVILIVYTILHIAALVVLGNILFYLIGILLLVISTLFLGAYIFLDWLFDFYIVTNKKIIDLHYAPPFSHNISSILLDQVRCTEVDTQKAGFFQEILDIGDVTITFDRPTHKESFTLHLIKRPEQVSLYLGQALTSTNRNEIVPFWYRSKRDQDLHIGEDLPRLARQV